MPNEIVEKRVYRARFLLSKAEIKI